MVHNLKITLDYSEKLHFTASARNFEDIHVDEPESFHGSNLGPSSVEYILIGIGGCLGSSLIYCLQKKKVQVDELSLIVEGIIKHVGPKMHLKLIEINVEINFKAKKTFSQEVENCLNVFQDYCVVTNSLLNGIPINVKYNNKDI